MKRNNKGPGKGVSSPHRPKHPNGNNTKGYSGEPDQSLAVDLTTTIGDAGLTDEVMDRFKDVDARRHDIEAHARTRIAWLGYPPPDMVLVVLHHGRRANVKDDCMQLAREHDASVAICDPNGKLLSYVMRVVKQ